mgnify:CR=1 FL=1
MSDVIIFARIVPAELSIITSENNNVIDLALCCQLRDPATGDDIWQSMGSNAVSKANILSWNSFVQSFYSGGDGDFGISPVAGRMLTMIGVSGEYANGVPQAGSALTHASDRARTDQSGSGDSAQVSISGVSILNDVTDSIVFDLGLPHDSWDSCSYMNVVNELQDIHCVADITKLNGVSNSSCSLSLGSLVHEIAASYDTNVGLKAKYDASAINKLYTLGMESSIYTSMAGRSNRDRHILAFSILFKNSTVGVRNIEFRIHFMVSNLANNSDLETLCSYSSERAHFLLDGNQI